MVASGMIQAGKLERELTSEIHALAQSKFGVRRHWHKRIARAGANTLLTYGDEARIAASPPMTSCIWISDRSLMNGKRILAARMRWGRTADS